MNRRTKRRLAGRLGGEWRKREIDKPAVASAVLLIFLIVLISILIGMVR